MAGSEKEGIGSPFVVDAEEMVVELVDLAGYALVPAADALDLFAEVHAPVKVITVQINDASAGAVDLPHGTGSENAYSAMICAHSLLPPKLDRSCKFRAKTSPPQAIFAMVLPLPTPSHI